jgi:hypothetical protein
MLSLLAFKKSLFAGALDGGQSEVSLHGGKLAKFMESDEQITGSLEKAAPATEEELPAETAVRAGFYKVCRVL